MENLELEQRVWERVGGRHPLEPALGALRGMEAQCREEAECCRVLAGSLGQRHREQLLRMQQEAAADAAAIRGIRILAGEEPEAAEPAAFPRESIRRMLAVACRRSVQLRREEETHSADPDFGPLFSRMAEGENRRLGVLLGLLSQVV